MFMIAHIQCSLTFGTRRCEGTKVQARNRETARRAAHPVAANTIAACRPGFPVARMPTLELAGQYALSYSEESSLCSYFYGLSSSYRRTLGLKTKHIYPSSAL